jgi:hypothetical protein
MIAVPLAIASTDTVIERSRAPSFEMLAGVLLLRERGFRPILPAATINALAG